MGVRQTKAESIRIITAGLIIIQSLSPFMNNKPATAHLSRLLKNKHQAVSQGDYGLEAWRLVR